MQPAGTDKYTNCAKLRISSEKDVEIADGMIGLFFEDINFAADGGLYAEQIENRSFEHITASGDGKKEIYSTENDPGYGWTIKSGSAEYKTDTPMNKNNTHYVEILSDNTELTNKAYDGVYVEKDKSYSVSAWAKLPTDAAICITVQKDGVIAFSGSLSPDESTARDDGWEKYAAEYKASATMSGAEFSIAVNGLASGDTASLDMVSMMPKDAVCGVFRTDLTEAIKDIRPGFLRFPGGCAVEGYDLSSYYHWKDTVGPIEERKQSLNRWAIKNKNYNETYGLGFYEYFLLCEYLECKALPIIGVGMACEYNTMESVPLYEDDGITLTEEIKTYIQEAIDLVEFANGDVTTKWGTLRAEMGHPEPFGLEMIGIGNEQWEKTDLNGQSNMWHERYEEFEKAIHAVYPDIKLISTAGPDVGSSKALSAWQWIYSRTADDPKFAYAVDEHNYAAIDWLLENNDFYDGYSREIPVYLGEYAAKAYTDKNGTEHFNDLISALAEAAFMTGLERNADAVMMASYAPLFAREGYTQWKPDMIWFNDTSIYKTPNYYVQKMYGNNMGDYTLKAELESPANMDLYFSVSYKSYKNDSPGGEIIIKLVDPNSYGCSAELSIDGSYELSGEGKIIMLTSENKTDKNSFEAPDNVTEQTRAIDNAANNMSVEIPPYSFVVIRLKTV